MKSSVAVPTLLLVEPQFVLRRTIVSVAQQLNIADFKEASDENSARRLLATQRFDGVVIDFSSAAAPFGLLSQLREGMFVSAADIEIVAMTLATIDTERDDRLQALGSLSLLRKPFKVAELLQMVQRISAPPALDRCPG